MGIRDSKETYNEYMRKNHILRYHKIRRDAIARLGGKCKLCGEVDYKKLQLDHIKSTEKEIEISLLLNVSKEKFEKELKKCQVLCKLCHIEKTIIEAGKKLAKYMHGTLSSYRYCHCKLCREAKRIYTAKYRMTHKRKPD